MTYNLCPHGFRLRSLCEPCRAEAQAAYDTPHAIPGMGPDAPTVTNKRGGSQSHLPYRFDLFDGPAMFRMAEVLHQGAEQYGPDNWRKIDVADHLNHLIAHAYAWIGGDRSDDHLSHIMCRAMFACAVQLTEEGKADG